MANININFDEVPDKMESVEPGVYTVQVVDATIEPTADGKNEKVVAVLRVDDESSKFHGRQIYDHLSLKMPINLKQLIKSCGLQAGKGFDTSDLIGKIAKVRVKARTYKDKETGEVKETTSVAEYLF